MRGEERRVFAVLAIVDGEVVDAELCATTSAAFQAADFMCTAEASNGNFDYDKNIRILHFRNGELSGQGKYHSRENDLALS